MIKSLLRIQVFNIKVKPEGVATSMLTTILARRNALFDIYMVSNTTVHNVFNGSFISSQALSVNIESPIEAAFNQVLLAIHRY